MLAVREWDESSLSQELRTQPRSRALLSFIPKQSHRDELITTIPTAEMLSLMLSGKLSPWKRKGESPQISVESHPRTVNIFGSPQRTNAFLILVRSGMLKIEYLQAD